MLSRPSRAPTAWVAEADGRIVGTYCGTPIGLRLCGTSTEGIHGSHAMTAPEYRRQGILTRLASAAQAGWSEAGYRLQIGVPWGTWGSRRAALGWLPVTQLVWLDRWLAPERALARRLRVPTALTERLHLWRWLRPSPPPAGDVQVRELARAEPALDCLWSRLAPAWEHAVVREAAWLDWRYLQAPAADYRILLAERGPEPVGYLALRIQRQPGGGVRGWIVDLLAAPGDAAARRSLLAAALSRFETGGVERAAALVPADSGWRQELAEAGFVGGQGGDFAVVPLDPTLPVESVLRADRWLVMGGDFDVV